MDECSKGGLAGSLRTTGKVAVVTGAGSGIGGGIATEMAKAGADIVVADTSDEAAVIIREYPRIGGKMATKEIRAEDKEKLAKRAYESGYYHQGHERCCSQSAVAAVMEALDFKDDGVFKAATALAGGGALFTDSGCGAYTGGLLIIGLLKGRPADNFVVEERDRFRCFQIGRALHKKFIDRYGTVICRDIMTKLYGRPFWPVDPDEYAKADALGSHTTVGPEVVGNGAKWAVEVIFEENLLDELNALRKEQAVG